MKGRRMTSYPQRADAAFELYTEATLMTYESKWKVSRAVLNGCRGGSRNSEDQSDDSVDV